jgi:maltose alpha-D-glucosyltransferase/alpha-amylase
MNGLLFSMPGTPIMYYGDEIGMGDNIYLGDRNGVRTPMQWSADRNAGFSRANPQKLYLPVIIDPEYHYEAVNVEAQQNNPNSLLWWTKRLIALRKRYKAFSRGTVEFLQPANRKVLAFVRNYQDERVLVVANLSRFVQHVQLDLDRFNGLTPVEMFGQAAFPTINGQPYFLTLGPHSFYWFSLEARAAQQEKIVLRREAAEVPPLTVEQAWDELFRAPAKADLEETLPAFLARRGWFPGAGRETKAVRVREAFRTRHADGQQTVISVLDVEFADGTHETFLLPVSFATGDAAAAVAERSPAAVFARVEGAQTGLLYDAVYDPRFTTGLLGTVFGQLRRPAGAGELIGHLASGAAGEPPPDPAAAPPVVSQEKLGSSSVVFGQQLVLKVFRRVEEGTNPDLELGRYFAQRTDFRRITPLVGSIEYRSRRGESITLATLHRFVPNETNGWQYTLDELSRFFERVVTLPADQPVPGAAGSPLDLTVQEVPPVIHDLLGTYFDSARQLGLLTADMHRALAHDKDDPAFTPEPYTSLYQRSVYQSLRNLHRRAFDDLRARLADLPEADQGIARSVLEREEEVLNRFRLVLSRKFTCLRTRYHGDFHLGKLLFTGKDFLLTDFEGNPARSITDRRIKRSPVRDVASMLRSLHYVYWSAVLGKESRRGQTPGVIRPEDVATLERWGRLWYLWVGSVYLRAYVERAQPAGFLPHTSEELNLVLDLFTLEKAVAELRQELRHRPGWAAIPLHGILELLSEPTG